MGENSLEIDGDVSYKLTLFSDIKQNFQQMKENLFNEVSEAIENELLSLNEESLPVDTWTIEDEVKDDVPLSERKLEIEMDDSPTSNTQIIARNIRKSAKQKKLKSRVVIQTASEVSTTDCVDLADSDDELMREEPLTNNLCVDLTLNESLDVTIDDDDSDDINCLVSVKINWMDMKTYRFELRKHQKFISVFEEISEKENVPEDKILLILRDRIFISKEDTPESLKLTIIDIIEGGITKEILCDTSERRDPLAEDSSDRLEFKCVLKDEKKPLLVSIKKSDNMYRLMVKAATQLETSLDNLKFMFEGDILDKEATPEDLDMEGGEVIEIIRKQVT